MVNFMYKLPHFFTARHPHISKKNDSMFYGIEVSEIILFNQPEREKTDYRIKTSYAVV